MKTLSFLILPFVMLASCASVKTEKPSYVLPDKGLAPQTLASGECGLFLWTIEAPRTFVFFQKAAQGNALYYANESKHDLLTQNDTSDWNDVTNIDVSYTLNTGETLRVKGLFSEDLEGGRRVSKAAITTVKQDGWQSITPVSGVYACS